MQKLLLLRQIKKLLLIYYIIKIIVFIKKLRLNKQKKKPQIDKLFNITNNQKMAFVHFTIYYN